MIKKIVLTGGPGSGKTTVIESIKKNFGGKYKIIVSDETASHLMSMGLRPFGDSPISIIGFQELVLREQLSFKYKENKMILIEKICLKNMIFNKITKPNFISYKYDELKISKILKYKKKYMMLGWTVKSKNDYNNYKKYYDNLICEQILN